MVFHVGRDGIIRLVFILVIAVAIPIASQTPAFAWCLNDNGQVNIEAKSNTSGNAARGVKASVSSPSADANCGIIRSIVVIGGGTDFAEVGLKERWDANRPHPFVAWDGDAGYDDWHASYTIDEDVEYGLRIQDGNGNYNWTGYFTGAVLHTTGVLPFNRGLPITNTESDDPSGDTAFGHFATAGWCGTLQCQSYYDFHPVCLIDNDPNGHLEIPSDTTVNTRNGQTTGGCAGTEYP